MFYPGECSDDRVLCVLGFLSYVQILYGKIISFRFAALHSSITLSGSSGVT